MSIFSKRALVALSILGASACASSAASTRDTPTQSSQQGAGSQTLRPAAERGSAAESRATSPGAEHATSIDLDTCHGEVDVANASVVMRAAAPEIRRCYEQALRVAPTLRGTVHLTVRVASDGHVEGAAAGGDLDAPAVTECVREIGLRLTFAPLAEGQCGVVAVPFVFSPSPQQG